MTTIEIAILVDGETYTVTHEVFNSNFLDRRDLLEFEMDESYEKLLRQVLTDRFPPPEGPGV